MIFEDSVMVGIKMLTYNHEKYIAQAIEGVIKQKVNFKIKLYIGDDCSTDNTYSIVKKYKEKYPDIIEAYTNENNLGVSENSRKLTSVLKGKYTAFCEGDDYWIEPNKLQIQVDFLEKNHDYNVSLGRYKIYKQEANIFKEVKEPVNPSRKQTYDLGDYLKHKFSQTATFVLRTSSIKYPKWFHEVHAGDQSIIAICSFNSKIYFHNTIFSVYRNHDNSITRSTNKNKALLVKEARLKYVNAHTKGRYEVLINHLISINEIELKIAKHSQNNILKLYYYGVYFLMKFELKCL